MKIQTFVNDILKKINKSIEKDKRLLGRFVIRTCTFTVHEEDETFHYCFEIVDKETKKKQKSVDKRMLRRYN